MTEVLKKARLRSERAIEDLETKRHQREETDDDKPAAPWLNQLRKTAPPAPKPKPAKEVEMNGTQEDVPEFIKKVRTFSMSHEHEGDGGQTIKQLSPVTARKPPPVTSKPAVTAKPRLPTPSTPVDNAQPEVQDKPAWMKQRERQINMATKSTEGGTKPPPAAPKPPAALPNGSPAHSHPPPAKKPRPVPTPRTVMSPKREAQQPPSDVPNEQESPPRTPGGSVRDKARSLERGTASFNNVSPPQSPKLQPSKPPPPTRTTPVRQVADSAAAAAPTVPSKLPPTAGKPLLAPPPKREFREPAAPPPPVSPPSPIPPQIPTRRESPSSPSTPHGSASIDSG